MVLTIINAMKEYLSRCHKRILFLIDEGYTSQEIADKLFNSVRTIETHRHHIIKRMGVRSCYEAVAIAKKKGWL